MLRIGIDTGGTFTDLSVFDEADGRVCLTHKVPSQPRNPTAAIAAGLREVTARLSDAARYVLHGTTIGLNTLLEGREPAPGLLVTEGFRDILELDRQWRGDQVYNLFFDRPRQLVPRHLIRPVRERVDSHGREVLPLDAEQARAGVKELLDSGVHSVAVSLLFSFANPDHEKRLRAILQELAPDVYVTLSSEVDPQFREFERTSTAVVNAFIGPRVSSYVGTIEAAIGELLEGARVLIMQSNGGVATPGVIARAPVQTLMSGPGGRRGRHPTAVPGDRTGECHFPGRRRHELRHVGDPRGASDRAPEQGGRLYRAGRHRGHRDHRQRRRQHRPGRVRPHPQGRAAERRGRPRTGLLRHRRPAHPDRRAGGAGTPQPGGAAGRRHAHRRRGRPRAPLPKPSAGRWK